MKRIDSREIAITTDRQRQALARIIEDMESSTHPSVRAYAVRLHFELLRKEPCLRCDREGEVRDGWTYKTCPACDGSGWTPETKPPPILSDENYVKGRDNR